MRPPDEVKDELVRQWLGQAEEDFRLAERLVAEGWPFPKAVGFHSQQAGEKYIKAFLVWHQVEFPKTHDLGELLDLVASVDSALAASLAGATALNPYAVQSRYPGAMMRMADQDAQEALALAEKVRHSVLSALGDNAHRA